MIRFVWGKNIVPRGLFELDKYFRTYGSVSFESKKEGDVIIGISKDFRFGSIVTSGKSEEDLDKNIKDAILTSFEIPSSYSKEINIKKVGQEKEKYALA